MNTTKKIFLTIKKIELIKKKEFIAVTFNLDYKAFIKYIATLNFCFNLDAKRYCSKKV